MPFSLLLPIVISISSVVTLILIFKYKNNCYAESIL